MPISGYFDVVFGLSGTLTTVPDAIQVDGTVSYTSGWGVDYTLPSTNPSYKYIDQGHMNQLFYDITSAIQYNQQGSAAPFITSAMNGGSPYTYPKYATVSYGGTTYISNVAGNADTPPSSKWNTVPLGLVTNLYTGGTTTGSANAQVLASLSPATGFSLSNPGDTITCTLGYTNSGSATLAITSPSIPATAIRKNSSSGLVALTGGEMIAGNVATFTVDASSTYLVLDAGLPSTLFLQKANNLSDVASTATALGNLGGAPLASPTFTGTPAAPTASYGTSTTQLATCSFVQNALTGIVAGGIGANLLASQTTGTISAGATLSGSSLTPYQFVFAGASSGENSTGYTVSGTWQAMATCTSGAGYIALWYRIA